MARRRSRFTNAGLARHLERDPIAIALAEAFLDQAGLVGRARVDDVRAGWQCLLQLERPACRAACFQPDRFRATVFSCSRAFEAAARTREPAAIRAAPRGGAKARNQAGDMMIMFMVGATIVSVGLGAVWSAEGPTT